MIDPGKRELAVDVNMDDPRYKNCFEIKKQG